MGLDPLDEAVSQRLTSICSVCERELRAIEALEDPRLDPIVASMRTFHREVAWLLSDLEIGLLDGDEPP